MKKIIERELREIAELLPKVRTIAEKDDVITDDEMAILDSIEGDLQRYQEMLLEEDKKEQLSPNLESRMKEFKRSIFDHARKIAADDGRFYEDEWHLLELLHEFTN